MSFLLLALVASNTWQPIQTGVEYTKIDAFHVVRIDPKQAELVIRTASLSDKKSKTAARWARDAGLSVVINAGMFEMDQLTHVGLLQTKEHANNPRWKRAYKSLLVLGDRPRMEDHDKRPAKVPDVAVQNLRLIAATPTPRNVWSKQSKKWSEAAIAMDRKGRILFVFSRAPMTMRDFNRALLSTELGVVRAQHAEGGPEASLSIHGGGIDLDLCGSYETGFNENDDNVEQWPIPNVIGVLAKP